MKRAGLVTTAVAVASLGVGAPVAANPYPPAKKVSVSTPGAIVTVTGNRWGPTTTVQVETKRPDGSTIQQQRVTVGPDGTFTAPVRVPEDARDEIVVEVTGVDEQGEPRTERQVYGVATSANALGALPADQEPTGATPADVVAGAVLLGGAGLGVARLANRRRSILRRHG